MKPASQQPATAAAADPHSVRPRLIPGSDQTEGEIEASPEEQAALEQVIAKAMSMIHGRKSRDDVLKALHNPRASVAETVGNIAANILSAVGEQKATASGEGLDDDTFEEALSYLIPELLTVGSAAGIFPFDAPADDAEEVGQGTTEFDQQVRMSMLEAVKAFGEQQLRQGGAEAKSARAADEWASQVRAEVEGGTADAEYMAVARPSKLIAEEGAA